VTVFCATGNPGKLREFRMAAEEAGIRVETVPGLAAIRPCDETGDTFEANAILKAEYYGALVPGLLFADDSGLEVDALGGAPGVYSARFAGPDATDEANNRLLLDKLRGFDERRARFVCMIALADGGRVVETFRGTVEGEILDEARGPNGFGYDPLFFYPPFGCSFGEVPPERKLTVSHRGAALRALFQCLASGKINATSP
jgi:XTP/dITP diphosphohydrolase